MKLTVHRLNGSYVISDDGRIAKMLGLGTDEWHIVAPSAELVPDRLERMEGLIESAAKRAAAPPLVSGEISVGETTTGTTQPPVRVSLQLPSIGSQADKSINTMDITPQAWRRLREQGIKSIGQLAGFSRDELLALPGIGARVVDRAEAAMSKLGYRLKAVIS